MSESDSPNLEVNLTVFGETHRAIFPSDGWTYAEAKLAKQLTANPAVGHPGLPPAQIASGFFDGDPDCVMAIIRVTLDRAGRTLSPRDLADLNSINIEEIMDAALDALNRFTEASRADDPIATRAKSDEPSKPENGSTSFTALPSPMEPIRSETSGTPDSATT